MPSFSPLPPPLPSVASTALLPWPSPKSRCLHPHLSHWARAPPNLMTSSFIKVDPHPPLSFQPLCLHEFSHQDLIVLNPLPSETKILPHMYFLPLPLHSQHSVFCSGWPLSPPLLHIQNLQVGFFPVPHCPTQAPLARVSSSLVSLNIVASTLSPSTALTHPPLLSSSSIKLSMKILSTHKSRESNTLNLLVPIIQLQSYQHFLFLFDLFPPQLPLTLAGIF